MSYDHIILRNPTTLASDKPKQPLEGDENLPQLVLIAPYAFIASSRPWSMIEYMCRFAS